MMITDRIAVIDCRMSSKCKSSLKEMCRCVIEIQCNPLYDEPISAHPDIFYFEHSRTFVLEKGIYLRNKHLFDSFEGEIHIADNEEKTIKYPFDCSLNFAVCGKYIIGNKSICHDKIVEIASSNGLEFLNVNQGYAKCNVCVVSDNAIITEDKGIAEACKKTEIDVLLLETHAVKLDGYKYGFIGGASGRIISGNENCVVFCGDIKKHPEYNLILQFCKKHDCEIISLSDEELYDRGSIFFF